MDSDNDLSADHEEIGGLRWGMLNATWPFALFIIHKNRLRIELGVTPLFRVFEFAPKDVLRVQLYKGFVSRGVQIVHTRQEYPQFIVFWSFRSSRLLDAAKEAGFTVGKEKLP